MPGRPIRVVFERRGDARFLSHLDFLRVVERAVRRSGVPVDYTEGFNPRIRLSMPPAVPVGVGVKGDSFTLRVGPETSIREVHRSLEQAFPAGIRVLRVEEGPAPAQGVAWLSVEVKDGPAAALSVVETLEKGDDARFDGAIARQSVVYVQLTTSGSGDRSPRIRDCVERIGQLLATNGYSRGTGLATRLSGPHGLGRDSGPDSGPDFGHGGEGGVDES